MKITMALDGIGARESFFALVVSPTPPSSLGLDRTASAARSGRQELRDRYDNHNETGPALTAGDIDADWESAYSTGDEAPGGDNPTPDQNVVDDIGLAVGVAYDDNEELEGADRIEERDRARSASAAGCGRARRYRARRPRARARPGDWSSPRPRK